MTRVCSLPLPYTVLNTSTCFFLHSCLPVTPHVRSDDGAKQTMAAAKSKTNEPAPEGLDDSMVGLTLLVADGVPGCLESLVIEVSIRMPATGLCDYGEQWVRFDVGGGTGAPQPSPDGCASTRENMKTWILVWSV